MAGVCEETAGYTGKYVLQIQLESNKIMDFVNTYTCFWATKFGGRSVVKRLTTHSVLWTVLVCRVIVLIPVHTYSMEQSPS